MKKRTEKEILHLPEMLPVIPVRDIVVFPYMVIPLFISREKSVRALEEALSGDRLVFLVAQKNLSEEDPATKDLYAIGTVALVMRMLKLPDGKIKILVQGLSKASMKDVLQSKPFLQVKVENIKDPFVT